MNYFYLVRHGQKVAIAGDPGLTDLGVKQAKMTADYLKNLPIKHLYTSPLKRCKETAEYISKRINLPVSEEKGLIERMNWGDDSNLNFEEFLKLWEYTSIHRNFKPKFGNSSIETGKRLKRAISKIYKQYPNSHSVLVTSAGTTVDFLRNVFSERTLKAIKSDFLEEKEKHIKECSITIIGVKNGKFYLEKLASVEHLPFPIE